MIAEQLIQEEENKVSHAYLDSQGFLTIGIGHLIDEKAGGKLDDDVIYHQFKNDVGKATLQAETLQGYAKLNTLQQAAVISMVFQLGIAGVKKFTQFCDALARGDVKAAAAAGRDSLWDKQTHSRAEREMKMLETGQWVGKGERVKRTLLIDADIIAYKYASVTESVFYFDGKDAEPAVDANLEEAIEGADKCLDELMNQLFADDLIICLTDRGHEFRKDIWPEYKANRKGRKPTHLFDVLDHFAAKHKSYLRPRLEADDCMGILATHPSLVPGEKVIVSEDKDMQSIPGLLFNPGKDLEPRKISKLTADRFHLAQTIIGDTTDNYPGARGIGPKSPEVAAVLASKTVEEAWRHVLAAFFRAEQKEQARAPEAVRGMNVPLVALTQARCARILRASDWNFKEKRPILWMPPRVGAN